MPSLSRDEANAASPSWERFFSRVHNKAWLAAKALLELDPNERVLRDAARWITEPRRDGHLADSGDWVWDLELDWDAWIADVDENGRAWSSSEHRLFEVAAALAVGRPFNIVGVLDRLGPWKFEAWRILTEWGAR
ncbi:hypothetical protein ACFQW6_00755 [Nocardioides sp. GCM10028917]|uniref:hypothetical protein n=1 Tax=Nocardioides sp. GCM10028917 TaxID=3273408 RepID=UPI00361F33B8